MKTIINPKDHETILSEWRGAKAAIWAYHISLKRMAIILERTGDLHEFLYILGLTCEHVSGPFRWSQANITVTAEPPNQWGEIRHRIIDKQAGFELVCRTVTLALGPGSSPHDPFDGFFGDQK